MLASLIVRMRNISYFVRVHFYFKKKEKKKRLELSTKAKMFDIVSEAFQKFLRQDWLLDCSHVVYC